MSELERIQKFPVIKPEIDGYSSVVKIVDEFTISPNAKTVVAPEREDVPPSILEKHSTKLSILTVFFTVLMLAGLPYLAFLVLPLSLMTGYASITSFMRLTSSDTKEIAPAKTVETNTITDAQITKIVEVMSKDAVARVNRKYKQSVYPSLHQIRTEEARNDVRRELRLPTTWGPDNAIEVQRPDTSELSHTYLVKTASNKVAVVKQAMVPEDKVWLENFRKCLQVK